MIHNNKWLEIHDHFGRIFILGRSETVKNNTLLILFNKEFQINEIYL